MGKNDIATAIVWLGTAALAAASVGLFMPALRLVEFYAVLVVIAAIILLFVWGIPALVGIAAERLSGSEVLARVLVLSAFILISALGVNFWGL